MASSLLPAPCSATAYLSAVESHAQLVVGLLPTRLVWCIRRAATGEIINQGEAQSFAEIRGIQVRAGIWDVICSGLDRPDLHEAARAYGWEIQAPGALLRASAK